MGFVFPLSIPVCPISIPLYPARSKPCATWVAPVVRSRFNAPTLLATSSQFVDGPDNRSTRPYGVAAFARNHSKALPDWLFLSRRGELINEDWPRRVFAKVLKRAGLPWHTPYDLRHTFATLHLAKGHPITYVSAQLGHSDPAPRCAGTPIGCPPATSASPTRWTRPATGAVRNRRCRSCGIADGVPSEVGRTVRNQQVVGSNPTGGSTEVRVLRRARSITISCKD